MLRHSIDGYPNGLNDYLHDMLYMMIDMSTSGSSGNNRFVVDRLYIELICKKQQ